MTLRTRVLEFLCITVGIVSGLHAQDVPRQIRFVVATDAGERGWQGYLARLTPDSLQLRVRGTDTIATFSRSVVRSVERVHRRSPGQAAGVGCLAAGAALGALGYFGTHDPDSPGLEKVAGGLGLIVGCGVGALGGLAVAAVRGHGWEPWVLPDSILPSVPPNVR